MWSYKGLFDTRHRVSCAICDICNEDEGDSQEEISDKKCRVSTTSKEKALSLPVEEGTLYC